MTKRIELVVARYNENLDWTNDFQSFTTIYNKGEVDARFNTINLPNVGREGHTYLHHIISNYDQLAERTIFCQGNPLEHSPDIIDLIKCWQEHKPVQPLNWRWIEHDSDKAKPVTLKGKVAKLFKLQRHQFGVPPLSIRNNYQENHVANSRVFVDILGPDLMTIYPLDLALWSRSRKNNIPLIANNGDKALDMLWKELNFEETNPGYIYSNVAAQFSVSKQAIRMRPKSFYENLMSFLLSDQDESRRHGVLLERFWLAIFGYQTLNEAATLPSPNFLESAKA